MPVKFQTPSPYTHRYIAESFSFLPCNYERILFTVIKNDKFRHNGKVGREQTPGQGGRIEEEFGPVKKKYALLQFTRLIAFIKLGFTTFEAQQKGFNV